ncbi:MAG TPA: FAD-dependent oxidoreductase, partial [Ramlibacter sp.]|nr:FAD-dependent oxidoreductase [Ramlibacter sp.]
MPPAAWAGLPQWRILETGFGLGLNFLAAWRAWKDDPQRPGMLHYYAVHGTPVSAAAIAGQSDELGAQWFGLTPGVHRLEFEAGRVLLTLFVGNLRDGLRQEPFYADAILLDAPADLHTLKAIARHSRRGTTLAIRTSADELRRDLAQCGFQFRQSEGVAEFDPAWEPRGQRPITTSKPGCCVVIGAGLAGAAAAASLARRGWRVTVLDAATSPASGASGVPVAMIAPHYSPDDNLLSRLSRSGVRATFLQAGQHLRAGVDWQADGVLEHRVGEPDRPLEAPPSAQPWTRAASHDEKASAGLA